MLFHKISWNIISNLNAAATCAISAENITNLFFIYEWYFQSGCQKTAIIQKCIVNELSLPIIWLLDNKYLSMVKFHQSKVLLQSLKYIYRPLLPLWLFEKVTTYFIICSFKIIITFFGGFLVDNIWKYF